MFASKHSSVNYNNNKKNEDKNKLDINNYTTDSDKTHINDTNLKDTIENAKISENRFRIFNDRNKHQPKSQNKLKKIIPYEERLKTYNSKREEIFNDFKPDITPKVRKARIGYARRKFERTEIASTCLNDENDIRPYMDVKLDGLEFKGLMDSGASISCLGKNCIEKVREMGSKILNFKSSIKTADGRKHLIVGKVNLTVQCGNKTQQMILYLVPNLSQTLILGYDFWQRFGISICINNGSISEIVNEEDAKIHNLTPEQTTVLENVKLSFRCYTKHGLGKTNLEKHVIDTGDARPKKMRYYPVSPAVQSLIFAELDRMLELDVIEIAKDAEWNNRTTLVIKPGKNRLCLDARELNKVTRKDAYPLPNIDGLLARLGDTHFISAIDLKDAFWQIPLDESSRSKTAFTVQGRPHYQFKVMPFGLCNAAQRLCRLMDKVIPSELKDRIFVYLDDLLVVSPDFNKHMEMLQVVGEKLSSAGLTINMEKSKFCYKELRYLGYIVGGGKIKPDEKKLEAILNIQPPKSTKDVRKFLGTVGWYRRFIHDFSTLTAPLTDTLKKSAKFTLTPEAVKSFEELKQRLVTSPVLSSPDFDRPFFVQCDASNVGIGAVLFQKDDTDGEHPIEYFSRKLNTAQKNYSTTEKECLAVVLAIEKFRQYIELMDFTVITDHSSLQWLMRQQDLNGRLARWSLKLQGYKFSIEHRKGTKNVVPDMLSRLDMEELTFDRTKIINFNSEEFKNEKYLSLIDTIEQNRDRLPDLKVCEGIVYKRVKFNREEVDSEDDCWKIWLPEELTAEVITKSHIQNTSHGGTAKTLFNVREYFYWPSMVKQIQHFVKECDTCKEIKHPKQTTRPVMGREVVTQRPFQKIYVDFLGPYPRTKSGNAYIFIVLDHKTKFVLLKAMHKATSKLVNKFLTEEVFHKFGVPEVLHSDNGKQFTSDAFQELLKLYGVKHLRTAIHSPQANASERVNQTILSGIRSYLQSDQSRWDENLSKIECSLRSTIHSSTGISPYLALTGFQMITHAQAYEILRKLGAIDDGEISVLPKSAHMQLIHQKMKNKLHEAYERNVRSYNKRSRNVTFKPGQEVFRKNFVQSNFTKGINAKLCKPWLKCRIRKAIGNCQYEVENLKGQLIGLIHAQHLKQ